MQEGWVCPKCGRVFSPTTSQCPYCGGEEGATVPVRPWVSPGPWWPQTTTPWRPYEVWCTAERN